MRKNYAFGQTELRAATGRASKQPRPAVQGRTGPAFGRCPTQDQSKRSKTSTTTAALLLVAAADPSLFFIRNGQHLRTVRGALLVDA